MRRKMFVRLLIEYLIFAVVSFLTISICIPQMVYNHTVKSESAAMYRQATYIASSYGSSIINLPLHSSPVLTAICNAR